MKDINDFLPKIPNMRWGSVTNFKPTKNQLQDMNKFLPHDSKWHLILDSKGSVQVDGKEIRRRSADSMT